MPLNKEQKKIIKEAIHIALQDLEQNFPDNNVLVIEALQAITNFNASEETIAKFKQNKLWDSMQTIIALLAHPYPQLETSPPVWRDIHTDIYAMNYKEEFGEEAFKRGFLNLAAKRSIPNHGEITWHVPSRFEVSSYIHKRVNKTKNNVISYEYMLAINQDPALFKQVILDPIQLIDLAKKFPAQADALIQPLINDHTEFNRLITDNPSLVKGLIFRNVASHFPRQEAPLFRHLLADDAYLCLVPNMEMLKILTDQFPKQTAALIQPIFTKPEVFNQLIDRIQRVLEFAKNFPEYKEPLMQIIIKNHGQFQRLIPHEGWLPDIAALFPAHTSIFGKPSIHAALQEIERNNFKENSYQFSRHGFANTLFEPPIISASEASMPEKTIDSAYIQQW